MLNSMETVLSPYCLIFMVKKSKNSVFSLKNSENLTQNRQETGYCYYWNTVDANVCDMLIGLLWDTVIIGK